MFILQNQQQHQNNHAAANVNGGRMKKTAKISHKPHF